MRARPPAAPCPLEPFQLTRPPGAWAGPFSTFPVSVPLERCAAQMQRPPPPRSPEMDGSGLCPPMSLSSLLVEGALSRSSSRLALLSSLRLVVTPPHLYSPILTLCRSFSPQLLRQSATDSSILQQRGAVRPRERSILLCVPDLGRSNETLGLPGTTQRQPSDPNHTQQAKHSS